MQIVQGDRSITVVFKVQKLRRYRQKDRMPEFPFSPTCSIGVVDFFAKRHATMTGIWRPLHPECDVWADNTLSKGSSTDIERCCSSEILCPASAGLFDSRQFLFTTPVRF